MQVRSEGGGRGATRPSPIFSPRAISMDCSPSSLSDKRAAAFEQALRTYGAQQAHIASTVRPARHRTRPYPRGGEPETSLAHPAAIITTQHQTGQHRCVLTRLSGPLRLRLDGLGTGARPETTALGAAPPEKSLPLGREPGSAYAIVHVLRSAATISPVLSPGALIRLTVNSSVPSPTLAHDGRRKEPRQVGLVLTGLAPAHALEATLLCATICPSPFGSG